MQLAVVFSEAIDPIGRAAEVLGHPVAIVVQCHLALVQATLQVTLLLL